MTTSFQIKLADFGLSIHSQYEVANTRWAERAGRRLVCVAGCVAGWGGDKDLCHWQRRAVRSSIMRSQPPAP